MGEVVDLIAGRFRLGPCVSEGGMAYIRRADDLATGRAVAVKMLKLGDADTIARFEREARVLELLRHQNVVEHVAHGVHGGAPFLVLEWLEGCDLRHRLDEGPLDVRAAVAVIRGIARALVAGHELGVVHRDLKPENVFLVGKDPERVKVLDYGIARTEGSSRTRTGTLMGTPNYMSPEQATGQAADTPTDLWSLGVILFECLTGVQPFRGENIPAILTKVAFAPTPSVADVTTHVPEQLVHLCADLLEKSPKQRLRAGDVLERLAIDAPPSIRPSLRRPLGRSERTSACVLITGVPERLDGDVRRALTRRTTGPDFMPVELEHGGFALVLVRDGEAVDVAARAARRALALAEELGPRVPIAIVTTRLVARSDVGEAIEGAARLVARDVPGIVVDAATAALLGGRFDLEETEGQTRLVAERGAEETTRLLLGKATPFVGRDNEMALLESLYEEVADESDSRVVIVTGGAGAGKSRLFRELAARVARLAAPPVVWVAKGDPDYAGSPFALLEALARQALSCPASLSRAEQLATVIEHAAATSGAPPGLQRALTALLQLHEDGVARPGVDEIAEAWIVAARAASADRPLVLGIEDLHWGDRPSVLALGRMLAAEPARPLLIVAMARPGDGDALVDALAKGSALRIDLRPLRPKAIEALARACLGAEAATAMPFIVAHAQGNAFLAEELIRAAARGETALPESALAVAEARLDTLSPDVRRVFRAATIFGETTWASAVGSLVADPGLDQALDTLVEQELLVSRPTSRFAGERELGLRHALLREAGYATLSHDDRVRGHAAAFAWLCAKGERSAAVLASHAERGGRPRDAVPHFVHAARDALSASDHEAARALVARGLACGAAGEDRAALYWVEADICVHVQEPQSTRAAAHAALQSTAPGSVTWFGAMACLVAAAHRLSDVAEAERLFLAIHEAAREQLPAPAAASLLRAARSLLIIDLVNESSELAEQAASVASDVPEVLGPLHQLRALAAMADGRFDVALRHVERAVVAHTEAGNVAAAIYAAQETMIFLTRLGRFEEAEEVYEAAARRSSQPAATRHSLLENLALTKISARRDLSDAIAWTSHAEEYRASLGDARYVVACCLLVARGLILTGDPRRARDHLLARQIEAEEQPSLLGLWLATLADAERLSGNAAIAAGHAEAAEHEIEARRPAIELSQIFARSAIVEAFAAAGRADEATRAARRLREILEADAGKIEDERDRARFLEACPDNVDARALIERYA